MDEEAPDLTKPVPTQWGVLGHSLTNSHILHWADTGGAVFSPLLPRTKVVTTVTAGGYQLTAPNARFLFLLFLM